MAKQMLDFKTFPNCKGVSGFIDGNKLTIEVDLTGNHGASKSGKTNVVATTGGSVKLPNGVLLGVNVNRKP